jgi:hypothetical protein
MLPVLSATVEIGASWVAVASEAVESAAVATSAVEVEFATVTVATEVATAARGI